MNIKTKRKIYKILSPDESKALLAETEKWDLRDRLIIRLGLATGMRAGELAHAQITWIADINNVFHVNVDHIDGDSGEPIWSPKYGGVRRVPIPDKLVAQIREYIGERKKGYIFLSSKQNKQGSYDPIKERRIEKIYQTMARRINLEGEKQGIHTLRHTFATTLKHSGLDITKIQNMLGHKKLKTTMEYLAYLPMTKEETREITTMVATQLLE